MGLFKRSKKKAAEKAKKQIIEAYNQMQEDIKKGLKATDAREPTKPVAAKTLPLSSLIQRGVKIQKPEYNMNKVTAYYESEGTFTTIVDKFVEKIFQNGYSITGENPTTLKYVKRRLRDIAYATGISTREVLKSLTMNVVLYSNGFLNRYRNKDKSTGKSYKKFPTDNKPLEPIAGLFVEDTTSMYAKLSKSGRLTGWYFNPKASAYGNIEREDNSFGGFFTYLTAMREGFNLATSKDTIAFTKDEIMHVTLNKRPGYVFAMPIVHPVYADIDTYRMTEENVELLVYQYSHPILHGKAGNDKYHGEPQDVAKLKTEIERLESNGGLVTDERTEVKLIGIEGNVIDTDKILNHFKMRCIGGLRGSPIMVGETSSANRGTATTLSDETISTATEIQKVIEDSFNKVLFELLLESGLTYDKINDENIVKLEFAPVDLSKKIAFEEHLIQLWHANIITFEEFRQAIGRKPDVDENRLFFNVVQIALAEVEAKASSMYSNNQANNKANNKTQPSNQHGKKQGPSRPVNDKVKARIKDKTGNITGTVEMKLANFIHHKTSMPEGVTLEIIED